LLLLPQLLSLLAQLLQPLPLPREQCGDTRGSAGCMRDVSRQHCFTVHLLVLRRRLDWLLPLLLCSLLPCGSIACLLC
jgi:hypothetical protein